MYKDHHFGKMSDGYKINIPKAHNYIQRLHTSKRPIDRQSAVNAYNSIKFKHLELDEYEKTNGKQRFGLIFIQNLYQKLLNQTICNNSSLEIAKKKWSTLTTEQYFLDEYAKSTNKPLLSDIFNKFQEDTDAHIAAAMKKVQEIFNGSHSTDLLLYLFSFLDDQSLFSLSWTSSALRKIIHTNTRLFSPQALGFLLGAGVYNQPFNCSFTIQTLTEKWQLPLHITNALSINPNPRNNNTGYI